MRRGRCQDPVDPRLACTIIRVAALAGQTRPVQRRARSWVSIMRPQHTPLIPRCVGERRGGAGPAQAFAFRKQWHLFNFIRDRGKYKRCRLCGVTVNGERIASLRPRLNLETREHAGTDPVWRPGLGDLRTPEIVYCSAGQCNASQVLPQNPRGRVEQGSCGPVSEGDDGKVGYRRLSSTATC